MRRAFAALPVALAAACSTGPPPPDPVPTAAREGPVLQVVYGDPPSGPLEGLLPFYYDLYAFREDAGATRVVAAFAVPAGQLRERHRGGRTRYHFDVTLVLADTATGAIIRTDRAVFVAATGSLGDRHLLYTQVEVVAPPSGSTVQRVIMTDGSKPGMGQMYRSRYPIPDYAGSRLMLSDIALGEPDVAGGWERGDVDLALLPTRLFPESAFDVFYEVYNLPAGRPYRTEIMVEPLADPDDPDPADPPPPTRLRFTGASRAGADGVLRELRRVDTSLSRGRYRLTVTVTDQTDGESASRSRTFHVRGWAPGATLVPAAPRGPFPSGD